MIYLLPGVWVGHRYHRYLVLPLRAMYGGPDRDGHASTPSRHKKAVPLWPSSLAVSKHAINWYAHK